MGDTQSGKWVFWGVKKQNVGVWGKSRKWKRGFEKGEVGFWGAGSWNLRLKESGKWEFWVEKKQDVGVWDPCVTPPPIISSKVKAFAYTHSSNIQLPSLQVKMSFSARRQ